MKLLLVADCSLVGCNIIVLQMVSSVLRKHFPKNIDNHEQGYSVHNSEDHNLICHSDKNLKSYLVTLISLPNMVFGSC